jgi:hypothetical protein
MIKMLFPNTGLDGASLGAEDVIGERKGSGERGCRISEVCLKEYVQGFLVT